MKKLILASTLALMSASSFAADDHSGFRVGGGFGSDMGKYKLQDKETGFDADASVVLEAGYDFNEIFAVNVKGAATGFKVNGQGKEKPTNLGTAYELAVEGEAGYTFNTERGISIKPYGAVGGVYYNKDANLLFTGNSEKGEVRGRGAVGVRLTVDNGLYVDGRVQATDVSASGKVERKNDLLTQGVVTVGYKF
ncbi:porin family protein [Vibrio agarivorans]|uniref:porin family protein n=1 Tax=Vibrio agarivorans TaxID=153622 RepID=UPI00223037A0|nr:porin family protein [Vibrio agarivorans]MDN3660347.1 porin family protein [Vibrio agarivorans]